MIVGSLAAIATMGGTVAYLRSTRSELDTNSLCPVQGPVAMTVVLVDKSDALTVPQREDLKRRLQEVRDSLAVHDELAVYVVGGTEEHLLEARVTLCNPGDGTDVSPIYGNPRLARQRWDTAFAKQLDQAFDEIIVPTAERESPLMESIQSVAISKFGSLPESMPKRLIIVSDMLHNTSQFSQYSRPVRFEDFWKSTYSRQVKTDLRGARVTIFYVRRPGHEKMQNRDHVLFWEKYLTQMNGALAEVISLQG